MSKQQLPLIPVTADTLSTKCSVLNLQRPNWTHRSPGLSSDEPAELCCCPSCWYETETISVDLDVIRLRNSLFSLIAWGREHRDQIDVKVSLCSSSLWVLNIRTTWCEKRLKEVCLAVRSTGGGTSRLSLVRGMTIHVHDNDTKNCGRKPILFTYLIKHKAKKNETICSLLWLYFFKQHDITDLQK